MKNLAATQETKARKEAKRKLRKRPKWKLREEQTQLMEVQKILRMRLEKCDEAVAKLRNAEIVALKKGDGDQVTLIESMIKQYELESVKMEKRYKYNGEILKLYLLPPIELSVLRLKSACGAFTAATGAVVS